MSRFRNRFGIAVLLAGVCFASGACRRDMQDQPKMKPFRGTSFFSDGISSRPPVEGTIARGFLRSDRAFFSGKKEKTGAQPGSANTNSNPFADDVDTFPFPITEETVRRGKERYQIFCSVCHGMTGNGDGMIVRRGFRRAASFNDDRLRQAPVGHFFDAITNGWGAMPPYAQQIVVQDRWAIIAYIRALQLSQQKTAPALGPSGSPATQPPGGAAVQPAAASPSPQQRPAPSASPRATAGGHQ